MRRLSAAVPPARYFSCHEDTKPRRLHEEYKPCFLLRGLRCFVGKNEATCSTAIESGLSKRRTNGQHATGREKSAISFCEWRAFTRRSRRLTQSRTAVFLILRKFARYEGRM